MIKSPIAGLFLSIIAAAFSTNAALAHSKMSGSTPANGATVTAGLEDLTLTFDRKVRLTRVQMHQAPEGMTIDDIMANMSDDMSHDVEGQTEVELTSKLPRGFEDAATLTFEGLEDGVFMVHWIALAQDGHVMEGDVHFAVLSAE